MALKITSVSSNDVFKTKRFEPRYFLNRNMLSSIFKKYGETTIQEVATLRSGSTPVHTDVKESSSDAYFIKSAGVKRYNINKTTICYIKDSLHKERSKMIVLPGDVLVTNTGKYLGFASVIPDNIPEATTNQNISCLRLKETSPFDPMFLVAYLNSYFGQQEIESLLTRTGQKYLNSENFKKLRIPLLQKKQIEEISCIIKEAMAKETKAVALIEEAQNILYDKIGPEIKEKRKAKFFSTNLSSFKNEGLWTPCYSNPLYANTISLMNKNCRVAKLGDYVTFKSGDEVGSDSYIEYIDAMPSNIPFIRTTDIINYDLDLYPDFFVKSEVAETLSQELEAGDILFSKDGKLGMVGMITKSDRAIVGSGFSILRKNKLATEDNISSEYLFLAMSLREVGIYGATRRAVVASTITHLREDRLAKLEIPIADAETIKIITKKVRQAFELKADKKELIRNARKLIDSYLSV